MKKILFAAAVMALFTVNANAQFGFGAPQQQNGEPKAPELEYVVRLNVTLGQAYSSGNNGKGTRTIIPITGGTFEGPDIKGEVLPGRPRSYRLSCLRALRVYHIHELSSP